MLEFRLIVVFVAVTTLNRDLTLACDEHTLVKWIGEESRF